MSFWERMRQRFRKPALPELLPVPTAKAPEVGKPGGVRTFVLNAPVQTFNPYLSAESGSTDIISQMFVGLVATDPISTDTVPQLASSWEISEDKCRYTFELRQNLCWSDGRPLTSADVVFSYRDIIDNPGILSNYRGSLLVDGEFPQVEALDHIRVCFTLPRPSVPFLRKLGAPILPRHVFEAKTQASEGLASEFRSMWGIDSKPQALVVNGPWRLDKFSQAGLELVPNPHYYARDAQGQQLPYFEKLVFLPPTQFESEVELFNSGRTDALFLAQCFLPQLKRPDARVYDLGPSTGSLLVTLNQSLARDMAGRPVVDPVKSGWFRNPDFRRALAHGIDKARLIQEVFHGKGQTQVSHICPQNPFYYPDLPEYRFNLTKAHLLLNRAGFKKRSNGVLYDAEDHLVRFRLTALQNHHEYLCALIYQDWSQLGIYVELDFKSADDLSTCLNESLDWDAALFGMTGSGIDPHGGSSIWRRDGRMHLFNMGHPSYWPGSQATSYLDWEHEMERLYQEAATLVLEKSSFSGLCAA